MFRPAVLLAAALALSPLAAAPAFAQTPAAAAPTTAQAEALLKKTIADIQAGKPDYASMSEGLVTAMKEQAGATEQLKALGPVKTLTRVGTGENPWTWTVAFEAGVSLNWILAIGSDGKIAGLQVVPAT
ncbi:hypothetical protein [Caulobacter mirabilis]|uniref:DUF3887 domain-containing protein n=1 Tax=Caulobacter mirabilis TaxID=69666 RepID=A0A2D2B0B3_9CAUL|nr:hypothetical protein [Caulobacter mirabilis]ATQ43695.1 hypothetical protein CSW64_15490 [Caulobacter mirabilis]